MDEKPLAQETPLLLKNISSGIHSFEIRKKGYMRHSFQLNIAPGEIRSLTIDLESQNICTMFPDEKTIVLNRSEESSAGKLFMLRQGNYRIQRKDNLLHIEPLFPQQGLINALSLSIPLSIISSGLLTLNDSLQSDKGIKLSPATISSYTVSLAIIGIDIALLIRKHKFRRSVSFAAKRLLESPLWAKECYEKGEELLSLGRLDAALEFYSKILTECSESIYFPYALYKIARIHYLTGKFTQAIFALQLITIRYPFAELYDKSQKALADIYLSQGLFDESIRRLDSMLLCDPIYTRKEIDSYRYEIFAQWFQKDKDKLGELISYYQERVSECEDSSLIGICRYQLAYFLNFAGRKSESLEQLSLIPVESADHDLAEKINNLLERIGS